MKSIYAVTSHDPENVDNDTLRVFARESDAVEYLSFHIRQHAYDVQKWIIGDQENQLIEQIYEAEDKDVLNLWNDLRELTPDYLNIIKLESTKLIE